MPSRITSDEEPTVPPLDPRAGAVCPRCHAKLDASARRTPGTLPRCPKHGLAFVDAREIVDSRGDLVLGTTVVGRFTVTARIGAGSMGAVYRAHQEAVGRDIALKIVHADRAYDPETKARFEREARATSALVSPHTVTVFDFGEAEDGSWFLAMELLEGETLGERLRREGRLSPGDAVRIAQDTLKSLGEAHNKGIIHRDLKPDNIFLMRLPADPTGGPREMVKVLDFGIAKLVHGDEQRVDQLETLAGTVFGTPRYMSPEQAQGVRLDARTDLYSLGVILYQMLVGRPPFIDDDAVVVMARHIKEQPPTFAEVAPDAVIPPALESAVRRVLSKSTADRPQSAEQLSSELDLAQLHSTAFATGVHATSWVGPSPRPARSSRVWVGAAIAVVLGLGGGGYWAVRAASSRPTATAPAAAESSVPSESARAPAPAVTSASAPIASAESLPLEPATSISALPSASGAKRKPARFKSHAPAPTVEKPVAAPKPDEGYGRFDP